jgi:hypothetical protein
MQAADQSSSRSRSVEIGWWIFVLLACAQFTVRYVWRNIPYLDLPAYAHGSGMMPFQGRVLMAWVLKYTAASPRWSGVLTHMGAHLPEDLRSPYSVALLIVTFFAMVLCIVAGRRTLHLLTGDRTFSAWASLLVLYMAYFNLVVGYGVFLLPYDVLSLTAFVVSVWLVIANRYAALTLVIAIGTLNRETIIFVPLFLGLYTWFRHRYARQASDVEGRSWWIVLPYVAAQILIWLALRMWIEHHFRGNPLEASMPTRWFGIRLAGNLHSLTKPPQWALLLSLFGFTLPLFVAKYKEISDRALAHSTALVMGMWAIAMLLVGVVIEIRIFSELTAFLMPCIALIVWNEWVRPAARYRASLDQQQNPPPRGSF